MTAEPGRPLRALVLEDSEADFLLLERQLRREGYDPLLERVETAESFAQALDCGGWDLVISDYVVPGFSGLAAVEIVHRRDPDLPIIIVSGRIGEDTAVEAMKAGAHDYVMKSDMARLGVAVERELRESGVRRARRETERQLRVQATALGAAANLIFITDLEGRIEWINSAVLRTSGYTRDELIGQTHHVLSSGRHDPSFYRELWEAILAGETWTGDIVDRRKDGTTYTVTQTITPIKDDAGSITHYLAIQEDVTEARRATESLAVRTHELELSNRELEELHEQLRYDVLHDSLTGLPNRVLLLDRLGRALTRSRREQGGVVVMLLDVDDFKLVNDTLGHAAGDELLMALGARLRGILRGSETVARLGGDEFAFVIAGGRAERDIVAIAERIQTVFLDGFEVGGTERFATGALGIAVASESSRPGDLLRDADIAMYRAKKDGKGRFEFFDEKIRAELLRRLTLSKALEDALHDGALEVHYQPIVSVADGRMLAVEALVRWHHADWGWVEPGEFVPVAEENGLVVTLGRYVLGEAAKMTALWRKHDPDCLPLGVFVNLSPRDLSQRGFVSGFVQILAEHGLDAADIAFELTERVFIDEQDDALHRNLDELSRLGVRLVLDDFGTGYSALASLERLPLAALKIDRFFISSLRSLDDQAPVTRAVVGLGKALWMTVIGEGVESRVQLDYLRALGCDAAQGFHIARPQRAGQILELIRSNGNGAPPRPMPLGLSGNGSAHDEPDAGNSLAGVGDRQAQQGQAPVRRPA